MRGFKKLYKAGRVKRYHTRDIDPQNLGAHSWGVAMIVSAIYPRGEGYTAVPGNLLMAALTHDLAEYDTGDVPANAKWENRELNQALAEMEENFNVRHGIRYSLTDKEKAILNWADTFELCIYCEHQCVGGNLYAREILSNGLEYLKQMGFPTTEAKELYNEIFG